MNLDTALSNFNLTPSLYKKMSKDDLKLLIVHVLNNKSNNYLLPCAQLLLNNNKKIVRFKNIKLKPQINYSLNYDIPSDCKLSQISLDIPISQQLDIMCESSWNCISYI